MQKLITGLFIACLLAFGGPANAQDGDVPKFRFGLKGAPAFVWMKPDDKAFESTGTRIKFTYGLMTEFAITNNYSFVTGLDVSFNGGGLDFQDTAFYLAEPTDTASFYFLDERKFDLQYVDLPILLKMKTNEIGYLTYFGQFGFNLGVNIKADAEDKGTLKGVPNSVQEDVDIIKDINFMRIALNVGLGFEYNFSGNTSLVVGVNYNNGFTNVTKKESENVKDNLNQPLAIDVVSNFVSVTVGILF